MKFDKLKTFTDKYGIKYKTKESSIFLYSLIRLQNPKSVFEFGTGTGVSALWMAAALEENAANGLIYTFDNGSQWNRIRATYAPEYQLEYEDYIQKIKTHFGFNNLIFRKQNIDYANIKSKDIDIIFCDFDHGVANLINLLAHMIPKMNSRSMLIIDSAPTSMNSLMFLNKIVDLLNDGKPIKTLLEISSDPKGFIDTVSRSKFNIMHIVKNNDKYNHQNGLSIIQMNPSDFIDCDRKVISL